MVIFEHISKEGSFNVSLEKLVEILTHYGVGGKALFHNKIAKIEIGKDDQGNDCLKVKTVFPFTLKKSDSLEKFLRAVYRMLDNSDEDEEFYDDVKRFLLRNIEKEKITNSREYFKYLNDDGKLKYTKIRDINWNTFDSWCNRDLIPNIERLCGIRLLKKE